MSIFNWELGHLKAESYIISDLCEKGKEVSKRQLMLNSGFEWNEQNISHMKKLFKSVFDLQNRMYDEVAEMKKDFDALAAAGNGMYKNYDITASIHLRRGIRFPYADDNLLSLMEYFSEFDFTQNAVHASSENEMRSREETFSRELNWNIEIFEWFRKHDDNDPYIPYFFHTVFQDGDYYSIEDMLYIEPEDFVINREVSFWPGDYTITA